MMQKIFRTNDNIAATIVRIVLGIVLFPHGAQMLLGWFGGYGFSGSMGFLTGGAHLPYVVALLVIFIQFFGSLMLILGVGTRIAALGIFGLFVGMILTSHLDHGFFMNWFGAQKGEGYEYHLLVLGMSLALLIKGAGKWSIDGLTFNKKQLAVEKIRG
ncbi:MAG: DoxX family protein [Candidatus Dadabacteria bacterium]